MGTRQHLHYDHAEKPRHGIMAELVDRYAPQGGTVLDLGCGLGHVLESITHRRPDLSLTGTDSDERCLAATAERVPAASVVRSDLDQLHHDHQTFDVVVMSHVLEHLYAPADTVRQILGSTVTPGGRLIIAVPNPARPNLILTNLRRKNYANTGHVYAWDPSHWRVFLEHALGVNVEEYPVDVVQVFPRRWADRRIVQAVEARLAKLAPWWSFSNIAVIRN